MAPRGAAPVDFSAAPPIAAAVVAAVAAAPALWLVQLPAGFSASRLVGSKLRCGAGELGGGKLTMDGASLRLVAEEDRLATQLVVVSAPCIGQQVRGVSRRVTAVLEGAVQPARCTDMPTGDAAKTAVRERDGAAAGVNAPPVADGAQVDGAQAHGAVEDAAPGAAAELPSGKAKKRRKTTGGEAAAR